jgi:hypothetical protein
MTVKKIITADGEWHEAAQGPCRIQLFGRSYAHYNDSTPDINSAAHVESGNIAYPGKTKVWLKTIDDSDLNIIVTEIPEE